MKSGEAAVMPEKMKSFDPLASIELFQYDLQNYGKVLPETRQRVYDEELSSIAEGVDRASRTEFVLAKEGNDLVYFDRGQWRSYTAMLITGNKVAHHEATQDNRKQFLAEWSDRDLAVGYKLRSLQPGQVLSWTNGYPHEIEQQYGRNFMQQCGLLPNRQMGFIYRAECLEDGSIVLQSQTVDKSDREGFAAVQEVTTSNTEASMDSLLAAYDKVMVAKTGKHHYAGRTIAARQENAWDEIIKQKDLIEYFLDNPESLAGQSLSRSNLEDQTKQLVIGVWKAFKLRLTSDHKPAIAPQRNAVHVPEAIEMEVRHGYHLAQVQGDVKVGCGGAMRAPSSSESVDYRSTFSAIFGADEEETNKRDWKWKQGTCRVSSCSTRPGKTKVGPCDVCVRCQAKFDAGEDPTKQPSFTPEVSKRKPEFDVVEAIKQLLQEVGRPRQLGRERHKRANYMASSASVNG